MEDSNSKQAIQDIVQSEKRAFENEAETSILKAISTGGILGNGSDDVVRRNDDSHSRKASIMLERASIVRTLPPVLEEGSGANKTLGLMSDSSLSCSHAPPKLRDIAQRIRMIQKVSSARRNSKSKFKNSTRVLNASNSVARMEAGTRSGEYEHDPEHDLNQANSMEVLSPDMPMQAGAYQNFCYSGLKIISILKGRKQALSYFFKVSAYFCAPLLLIAACLFYYGDNPIGGLGASYSWWILFIIRQCLLFMLAQTTQFFLIDVIVLETKVALMIFGRVITLIAMQVRGWPTLLVIFSGYSYGLSYGQQTYVKHWLFWQNSIDLFNENNPSGTVTSNPWYGSFLIAFGLSAFLAMIKRVVVAIFFGRKKYAHYGAKIEQIMMKVLLLSEVALLSEEIQEAATFPMRGSIPRGTATSSGGSSLLFSRMQSQLKFETTPPSPPRNNNRRNGLKDQTDFFDNNSFATKGSAKGRIKWAKAFKKSSAKKRENRRSNFVDPGTRAEIQKMLEWDEPQTKQKVSWNDSSIRTILQFKETLNFLDTDHPLSTPFGLADTQKHCAESAEKIFQKLRLKDPASETVKFDTILNIALDADDHLDMTKVRSLKKLFKPRSNGDISMLDFVRATNDVYKRIKMFRAKTLNAAQLDDAFEQLINVAFYFGTVLLVLGILGVDPFNVFISMTGILVPLAFLFNDAGSQYFQGLLLILARQPYDIGDCISISDVTEETSKHGSTPWKVENITLFTTTVRSGPTNEVATISNGSLAKTRIINANRSQKAQVFVFLKLSIDVPYEKVKIFHSVVKEFVKDRPREWVKLGAFRAIRVEADQGYIEYELLAQHVEPWQIMGQVLQSRADLSSFCLEVMKQMGMRYESPNMPVNVTINKDEIEEHIPDLHTKSRGSYNDDDLSEASSTEEHKTLESKDRLKALSNLFKPPPMPPLEKYASERSTFAFSTE